MMDAVAATNPSLSKQESEAASGAADPRTPRRLETLLLEVSDAVSTTLDLDSLFQRIAEQVRHVVDYEIFAILLLNEKAGELRLRFQIGHDPQVTKIRIPLGRGITGQAAQRGEPVLVNDVSSEPNYINAHPEVRSELAVPFIAKNRVIGVIDIQSRQADYFSDEHRRLLTLVGSRIASAIENARLYARVARQAKTLEILTEISRDVTSILNLDKLLKRVGELLSRVIDYQMFSIMLLDPTGSRLQHRFSIRFNQRVQIKDDIPVGEGLVGYAASHKQAVLVQDVCSDPRYIRLNPETRSELVVPLIHKDKVIGVLDVEHTRVGYFTDQHQSTLTTLAAQVAVAIENARLYEEVQRQERRLQRDLELAREMQYRLLPASCPKAIGAEIAARYMPAYFIGGDLFDFADYSGGCTAIAVGDVSGKGAAAALYAGLVSGILRSTAASEPSAAEMLAAINLSLGERPVSSQFVSMLYAIWDPGNRTVRLANSGFPRPVFCRPSSGGPPERLEATGFPLGLFPDVDYEELVVTVEPCDVFVFMSDGILDATSPEGELFGRERVHRLVAEHCRDSAEGLLSTIFKAVLQHSCCAEPFDDQTVVVLKIGGDSQGPRAVS